MKEAPDIADVVIKKKKREPISLPAEGDLIDVDRETLLRESHLNARPPQPRILGDILTGIDTGKTSGFVHGPAGIGKTAIYVDFLKHFFGYMARARGLPRTAIVLVPGEDLLEQTPGEIRKFFPNIGISVYYGREKNLTGDIQVMTYQSFNMLVDSGKLKPDDVGCMILDEAHRALSDWRKESIDAFKSRLRIGFTATSEFNAEKTVEGLLEYQYHRMSYIQAVGHGLVLPYVSLYVDTHTDISGVEILKTGDYSERGLANVINTKERNALIVAIHKHLFRGRQAIAYCGTVTHSDDLADEFQKEGISAISITSKNKDASEQLAPFTQGQIEVATNPLKLAEGYNNTSLQVIYAVRPSFSQVVVGQSRPRAGRTHGDMPCFYVVEFLDKSERDPYTWEEYVLQDHRATDKDSAMTLTELRDIMATEVQRRGGSITIPDQIAGYQIASDSDTVEELFRSRQVAKERDLVKKGITPGEVPESWGLIAELARFANMDAGWCMNFLWKLLAGTDKTRSEHIRKYVGRVGVQMYYDESVFAEKVYPKYIERERKNGRSWQPPTTSFARSLMTEREEERESLTTTVAQIAQMCSTSVGAVLAYGPKYFGTEVFSAEGIMDPKKGDIKKFTREVAFIIEHEEITLSDILTELSLPSSDLSVLRSQIQVLLIARGLTPERVAEGRIHMESFLTIIEDLQTYFASRQNG